MTDYERQVGQRLRRIRGVDAVFVDGTIFYAVVREHGDVNRRKLLKVEDAYDVDVRVRAHQGRPVESVLPGLERVA